MKVPKIVMSLGVFLSVAACAQAAAPAETPLPPDVTLQGPPAAILEVDGETQIAAVGSHCWPYPDSETAICADFLGVSTPREPLPVRSPIEGTIDWSQEDLPDRASGVIFPAADVDELESLETTRIWDYPPEGARPIDISVGGDLSVAVDSPGLYVLSVHAAWEDTGDISYGFLVEVE